MCSGAVEIDCFFVYTACSKILAPIVHVNSAHKSCSHEKLWSSLKNHVCNHVQLPAYQ